MPEETTGIMLRNDVALSMPKRNVLAILEAAKEEAKYFTLEQAIYKIPFKNTETGKTTYATGCTIGFAQMLFRNWGKADVASRLESETEEQWVIQALFIDYETGAREMRTFLQRKGSMFVKKDGTTSQKIEPEKKMQMTFGSGVSKATRNIILQMLPKWYVEQAADVVRNKTKREIRADKSGETWESILKRFADIGLTKADLVAKYGQSSKWTPEQKVEMLEVLVGIESGEATPQDFIASGEAKEEPSPIDDLKSDDGEPELIK